MFRVMRPKDFWAGVMFMAFGALFFGRSLAYPLGDPARMGPGFFPLVLGGLLLLLGACILILSFAGSKDVKSLGCFDFKSLVAVLLAVAAFGAVIKSGGFILASFVMLLVAYFGGGNRNIKEALGLSLVLIAASVAVFHYGLGLQFALFPASAY